MPPSNDAIDTVLAALTTAKTRHERHVDDAPHDHARTRHERLAEAHAYVIDLLLEVRDTDEPDTGVRIDTDELVIVEATPAGHRRRRYERAPPDVDADAMLTVERWATDGWVTIGGREYVDQLAINGRRPFGGSP